MVCKQGICVDILVQKYGGTSVGTVERIKNVARRIIKSKEKGYSVVVVVSAMSGETNRLIDLASQITPDPAKREMDMLVSAGEQVSIALLAIALQEMGHPAISMTAAQVGIRTDDNFMNARIHHVEDKPIKAELKKGRIVIVAGFQGIDVGNNITTLGRGGSDTSAVALAAAVKAKFCEIYTDVDGIYTADPNKVPDARMLREISYEEMLELASLGSKVLHSRSVEIAMNYNVILHVRSSLNDNEGTLVVKETKEMEKIRISGVTSKMDEARVTIYDLDDKPGIAAAVFGGLATSKINVDMIVQSGALEKTYTNRISFTVQKKDIKAVETVIDKLRSEGTVSGKHHVDNKIGIVSIVGVGMKSHTGVASQLFDILAKNKINIEMISTSEIKISCAISGDRVLDAVRAIHKGFGLGEGKKIAAGQPAAKKAAAKPAAKKG
jgi:aspartate kinase